MKRALIVLLSSLAMASAVPGFGKHDGAYLRDVKPGNFVTDSLQWCREPAAGKPRVLFIVPRGGAREVVELAQRMGIDFEAVAIFHSALISLDDMYEGAVAGTTPQEKTQEMLDKLDRDYDVIVLGNIYFDRLPPETQFRILAKVADGAGLVMAYKSDSSLKKLFANPSPGAEEILSMAPVAGLPAATRKVPVADLLKTYRFGKGRIAVLDYKTNHGTYYGGMSLTSLSSYSLSWAAEYENSMALLIRTLLWSSGKGVGPIISCPELAASPALSRGRQTLKLQIPKDFPEDAVVEARLRNSYNQIAMHKILEVKESPGTLGLELPVLAAGDYYLDIIARKPDSGGIFDSIGSLFSGDEDEMPEVFACGSFCFSVASPVGALTIETPGNNETFKENCPVDATLRIEKPLPGASTVLVELADSPYGRIWYRQEIPLAAGAAQLPIAIKDYAMPTIAGILICQVKDSEGVVARADKFLFFPKRKLEDFILMCWGGVPEHMAPFFGKQLVDRYGWRCGLMHPSPDGANTRNAAIFNQRQVPYTVRIGLSDSKDHPGWTQQGAWNLSGEDHKKCVEELQGDQTIYNPKSQEWWRKVIAYRVGKVPPYGPAFYSLGDENYFDYNTGFSPSEEREFRRFLENRYGTIQRLNTEWGTSCANFNDVKHLTMAQAKEAKNFPAWFDHRKFMEKQYADLHRFLAAEINKIDPGAIVGAEGSEPGDLEESVRGLKFWGPYSDLIGDELLRSLAPDRIRMLWWGGYVGSHGGRDNYPLPLWKDLLRGNVNGSAWYTSGISSEGCQGLDLGPADYMRRLLPHFDELNAGVAELLVGTPLATDGVAVLWSHPSASASLLDARCVNPRDSMGTFTNFTYATGLNFDYITENGIGALATGKYKVLFLFGATALSQKEIAAITKFVQDGGTVVADLNPGILNEFLRPLDSAGLSGLFGESSFSKLPAPAMGEVKISAELGGKKLNLAAAKALRNAEGGIFQVRQIGKGRAILLGFTLGAAESTVTDGTTLRSFLLELLSASGVKPSVAVRGISGENSVLRVRKGPDFRIIGLLVAKRDWEKTATFTMPSEGYVYELNKGFIGKTSEWENLMTPPLRLYAVFDSEQSRPAATLSSGTLSRGSAVSLDLSSASPGTVLRVRLLGPDGQPVPLRDQVLPVKAKGAKLSLPFAYTDPAGSYTVVVRDIRTGMETMLPLEVK